MKIEIDDQYIEWVEKFNPNLFTKDNILENKRILTNYINETLNSHRQSWTLEDDDN